MLPAPHPVAAPLMSRAVHLADRLGMDWADFLFLLEMVERYLGTHAAPPAGADGGRNAAPTRSPPPPL